EALKPGLEGQSMFFTLAIQAPRNSRCTAGGRSVDGANSAPGAPTTAASISANQDKCLKPAFGVWEFLGVPWLEQPNRVFCCVPEGDSRMAHPFKGGIVERENRVPKGRLNLCHINGHKNRCRTFDRLSRPFGTCSMLYLDPEVNCRAIFKSPSGRGK